MIQVTIGNNISRKSWPFDPNTTLREALESKGIDYTIGMTSLDGATLSPGELDKTFADFNITERCFLLNVVKADNAAAVKVVGGACVVESNYTLEQIKLLAKYRPQALSLFEGKDGSKEEVFKVAPSKGSGSITTYGACFGSAISADGKATITLIVPEGTKDAKAWAEDVIGTAILKLNKVEAQFDDAVADVASEQAAVRECIQVM